MLLSLWKKINFISCPFFPSPRSWWFKRRLKAKQCTALELSVFLEVCQDEHSLIGSWPWVSTVPTEAPPACCHGSCRPQAALSSPAPSLCLPSLGVCLCLWGASWAQEACDILSCLQALSYSLGASLPPWNSSSLCPGSRHVHSHHASWSLHVPTPSMPISPIKIFSSL